MRTQMLAIVAVLAAGPALAQIQQPSQNAEPGRLPPSNIQEGAPLPQQQAELPPEAMKKKGPGSVVKLRGGFMTSPTVEGDEMPQNGLGLVEPKKR